MSDTPKAIVRAGSDGEKFVIASGDKCPLCKGSLQDHLAPDGFKCRVCQTVFAMVREVGRR